MAQITLSSGSCSVGSGTQINYCETQTRPQMPPFLGARFETGCALIQQVVGENILTGPFVFTSNVPDIEIVVEPDTVEVTYMGLDGEEISDAPESGEPFYISVPVTDETQLVRLFALVDNCPSGPETPLTTEQVLTNTLAGMSLNAGFRQPQMIALPSDVDLPACNIIYDQIAFYLNPKPVSCSSNCSCINATVKGETTNDNTFSLPCCRCWEN